MGGVARDRRTPLLRRAVRRGRAARCGRMRHQLHASTSSLSGERRSELLKAGVGPQEAKVVGGGVCSVSALGRSGRTLGKSRVCLPSDLLGPLDAKWVHWMNG
ncbi:hypothetical protein SEVIR_1G238460v4 [Setaria viridis]